MAGVKVPTVCSIAPVVQPSPLQYFPVLASSLPFRDRFGRALTYLRISVTDRCNMRCNYCRPELGSFRAEQHGQILRFEEITRIVRVAVTLGIRKLRITGGEPLVRRGLPQLIEQLATIPGIEDLAMTSNATLLEPNVDALVAAGLQRINISLDSLDPEQFRALTGGDLQPVLTGIAAAVDTGLRPVKLNCVLMRGINDHEVIDLIAFARDLGATIRFIELMPMKQGLDWERHYLSIDALLQCRSLQRLIDLDSPLPGRNSASRLFPLRDGRGEVGFITPMSARFCSDCNRLRLTADGGLRSCLPADHQCSLRDLIRSGGSDDDLRATFLRAALIKPEIGHYDFDREQEKRSMIAIGG